LLAFAMLFSSASSLNLQPSAPYGALQRNIAPSLISIAYQQLASARYAFMPSAPSRGASLASMAAQHASALRHGGKSAVA